MASSGTAKSTEIGEQALALCSAALDSATAFVSRFLSSRVSTCSVQMTRHRGSVGRTLPPHCFAAALSFGRRSHASKCRVRRSCSRCHRALADSKNSRALSAANCWTGCASKIAGGPRPWFRSICPCWLDRVHTSRSASASWCRTRGSQSRSTHDDCHALCDHSRAVSSMSSFWCCRCNGAKMKIFWSPSPCSGKCCLSVFGRAHWHSNC